MELPWELSLVRAKEINFEGDVRFHNFAWSKAPWRVSQLSGRVPLSEKLVWDGKVVKFAYLITQNPFERVEYERLRPLLEGADQLRVEELGFEEKKYGPLVGFFSMEQNMLYAHQFDMALGSMGKAYGEANLDVQPGNLQVGFLSRITGVDLGEVLPAKFLRRVAPGGKAISARSGLVINLNRSSIDGRVDITEIGGSQLIAMVNLLDPNYENDRLNMVRGALRHGYPTFVEMAFRKGYMDMGCVLSLAGLSQRLDVRGIPFAAYLSSKAADIVKKTSEGPLQ